MGDDLYAHQPFCRRTLLHGFHFLFTCKPESHATLYQWVSLLEPGPDLGSLKLRIKAGSQWHTHTYRWANHVPLAEGEGALKVNWCELSVTDPAGTVLYRNARIGDRPVLPTDLSGHRSRQKCALLESRAWRAGNRRGRIQFWSL